jgi:hypothetical protein
MKSTIKIRQSKIENLLPWVWNGVQCDDSYSIAGRVDLASVEYGYNSFLRNYCVIARRLPIVSNIIVENPSDHCLVMATLLLCIFLEKVNTGFT